jgi:hypothetical protein
LSADDDVDSAGLCCLDGPLTARTGWQHYTVPATGAANVLFNTGRANQSVTVRAPAGAAVGAIR